MPERRWSWLTGCALAVLLLAGLWWVRGAERAPEPSEARPGPARAATPPELPAAAREEPTAIGDASIPKTFAARLAGRPSDAPHSGSQTRSRGAGSAGVLRDADPTDPASYPIDSPSDPFSSEALEAQGYHAHEIDTIRRAWRQSEEGVEARLAEIDPGLGPIEARQVEQEIRREARDALLEELGDEDYDALRYALGESNRLSIVWVPPNTPVATSGLMAGDVVVSVGGERFDSGLEYSQWLRNQKRTGDFVPVEVRRDDQLIVVDVPNGDIGLVRETSVPPVR